MEQFLVRKSAPHSEVQHLVNHLKEVPLKKKSIANRGAYKNALSLYMHVNRKEAGHCKQLMPKKAIEQGPGAPLQGVTVALAGGVS